MTAYSISIQIEANDIGAAFLRAFALVDKHGEGNPEGVTSISVYKVPE